MKEGQYSMQTVVTPEEQKKVLELEKMKRSLELQLQEMARKVEEQKQQIAMAMRDPLTGLRNREGVADQINTLLKKETKGTFFIMDMDNFKCVNDTYGHVEGDRVLVRFSSALRKVIESEDIVARLGGDEFIVFSPGLHHKNLIEEKAAHIIRRIERELVTPGRLIKVTVSMGIALSPTDGATFEALYTNADKALYFVKNDGKNAFRFYGETNDSKIKKCTPKASIEEITSRLREKKMEGSFVVEYGNFEKIYRFLERNIARENREVQCVLFTIDEPEAEVFDSIALQRQMEHLEHAITSSLRKGDVTTNYSSSQMLALLMDVNQDNSKIVIDRILQKYRQKAGEDAMEILYESQPLMPEEQVY